MSAEPMAPGPRGSWLFGATNFLRDQPLDLLTNWARRYGDVVSWRTFHIRIYLLNHPDDIETVLVSRSRSFGKGRLLQANRELFGNGLLTSEGEFWLRQRRLTQPAFHRERVAACGRTMVAQAVEMLNRWRDGEVRDIHHDMMRVTLAIAAEALFGASVELALLLAVITQRFRLRLASPEPILPAPSITLRPRDGMRLIVSRRS